MIVSSENMFTAVTCRALVQQSVNRATMAMFSSSMIKLQVVNNNLNCRCLIWFVNSTIGGTCPDRHDTYTPVTLRWGV